MLKKSERITITLSVEQLNLIDKFVEKDLLIENRSQFIRIACLDYMNRNLKDICDSKK